eukprot:CAMPEP_0179493410 /NCGR_PEP_ID=MMETSP0799-20121207/67429_1 /TAXON_ID=46947 /ORGANISM="Geminigera cryophila, Strain CCMP2564" /LENGTH=239 /DNA_ID=CAMNT_0021310571 /DNA_START=50 /DNA_END=770 /DNA_ORIENTATION=+
MRGVNLKAADVSGMSDPFVCFQGDAVMKSKSTEAQRQTLNPSWQSATLPYLHLVAISGTDAFWYERILVSVLDFDILDHNDELGGAVMNLRDYMTAQGEPRAGLLEFDLEISSCGLPAGTLQGSFTLEEVTDISIEKVLRGTRKDGAMSRPWSQNSRGSETKDPMNEQTNDRVLPHPPDHFMRSDSSTCDVPSSYVRHESSTNSTPNIPRRRITRHAIPSTRMNEPHSYVRQDSSSCDY